MNHSNRKFSMTNLHHAMIQNKKGTLISQLFVQNIEKSYKKYKIIVIHIQQFLWNVKHINI